MTTPWNRTPKRLTRTGGLHIYVITTRKKVDPTRLLAEMLESVGSVHSIGMDQGRLTVKTTMPCNDVDRNAIKTALKKHKSKGIG